MSILCKLLGHKIKRIEGECWLASSDSYCDAKHVFRKCIRSGCNYSEMYGEHNIKRIQR